MSQITIVMPNDTNRNLSIAAQASGRTIEQFVHDSIPEGMAQRHANEQDVQETLAAYRQVSNTDEVWPANLQSTCGPYLPPREDA